MYLFYLLIAMSSGNLLHILNRFNGLLRKFANIHYITTFILSLLYMYYNRQPFLCQVFYYQFLTFFINILLTIKPCFYMPSFVSKTLFLFILSISFCIISLNTWLSTSSLSIFKWKCSFHTSPPKFVDYFNIMIVYNICD